MIGDVDDFVRRLRGALPARWFGGSAPVLDAVLAGIGTALAALFELVTEARREARILSATGGFLDLISQDFFANMLPRWPVEADDGYRCRITRELLRPRATRGAMIRGVTELTGRDIRVFEPANPVDTGGYNIGGAGYNIAGGWGNLDLAYQCFVTAQRPRGGGIAYLAGYGSGGVCCYGNLGMVVSPARDDAIFSCIAAQLPAGSIAWTKLIS